MITNLSNLPNIPRAAVHLGRAAIRSHTRTGIHLQATRTGAFPTQISPPAAVPAARSGSCASAAGVLPTQLPPLVVVFAAGRGSCALLVGAEDAVGCRTSDVETRRKRKRKSKMLVPNRWVAWAGSWATCLFLFIPSHVSWIRELANAGTAFMEDLVSGSIEGFKI
jgi:hypothetical protein